MNQRMLNYGFTEKILQEASEEAHLYPGRIISQHKELYKVALAEGEVHAEVSGKMIHGAQSPLDFPVVGDFVLLDRTSDAGGYAIIHRVLPRKSLFVRKAAGKTTKAQAVGANIDLVFLCMALNKDYNLRRLERYFAVALDSGATPVMVLTKADLCSDVEKRVAEVERIALGYDVVVTSGATEEGYLGLKPYLAPGRTLAFMGSSGVGKSTLINRLLGAEIMATQGLRNDDKGRHTTTSRELLLLEEGGTLLDTPGMRELGLDGANLEESFEDIHMLAAQCKFSDCRHDREPGCAVREALDSGELTLDRLESYRKLKTENPYEGLSSRQIEKKKIDQMFGGKSGLKQAREIIKNKKKR
ncbi:ribosome small subunit-dependent GTPase A [Proteiniclasticum sediminis]|nr:ribosome small subunit-dependent GTPase A [Proteiniclasticum sediminis]